MISFSRNPPRLGASTGNELYIKRILWLLAFCAWFLIPTQVLFADKISVQSIDIPSENLQMPDIRVLQISSFLNSHGCGSNTSDFDLSEDFVASANKYMIDYRTLVPIYFIESTCGKHGLVNNYFGWESKNGLIPFDSVADSISHISDALSPNCDLSVITCRPYKDKTLERQIKTYNSANPNYWNEYEKLYDSIKF